MKKITFLFAVMFLLAAVALKAQCPTGEENIKISIKTDNYGSETTWTLKHQSGSPTYDSGGPYTDITGGQLYVKNVCVPENTPLVFEIKDSYGDGMCCSYGNGYYTVELYGYTYVSGGEYGTSESTEFVVSPPPARDMAVAELNIMEYISVGNITIAGKVKSLGGDTVTAYKINYSINGGTPVSHTLSSQSIMPFTTVAFSHPTPFNATTSGAYNVKVWASEINGQADLNTDNDTIEASFVVVSQVPQKYVLIEQATGAWCGYCPDGSVKLAQILASNPYAIGVAIHNGDAMAFTDGNTVNSAYATAYPNGFVDRYLFSDASAVGMGRSLWQAKSNERMAHVVPCAVNVANTYNQTTRQVTVTVSATFYADLNEELRFNAYIVEDSLSGTGTGWSQSNNYNTQSGHPMYGLGNPIVGYKHRHVLKTFLGGPFGTANSLPATVTDGQTYTKEYTYTLPAGMKEKDVHIIGTVSKYDANNKKRAILNSKQTTLAGISGLEKPDFIEDLNIYPNPAADQSHVIFALTSTKNVKINVYNILGQNVESVELGALNSGYHYHTINTALLGTGLYQVVINFDNTVVTRKLIVE